MTKSHYGWKLREGEYYCLNCAGPLVTCETVLADEAHKRCCSCAKRLREVVEELDQKGENQ